MTLTQRDAMDRAERLADRVRSRRRVTEDSGRLPDETIADFVESDLLRMNQASRWGDTSWAAPPWSSS